jgi:hypothetical protein
MKAKAIDPHAPILLRENRHHIGAARIVAANCIINRRWIREMPSKPIPFIVVYWHDRELVDTVQKGNNRNRIEAIVATIAHLLVISLSCPLTRKTGRYSSKVKVSSLASVPMTNIVDKRFQARYMTSSSHFPQANHDGHLRFPTKAPIIIEAQTWNAFASFIESHIFQSA